MSKGVSDRQQQSQISMTSLSQSLPTYATPSTLELSKLIPKPETTTSTLSPSRVTFSPLKFVEITALAPEKQKMHLDKLTTISARVHFNLEQNATYIFAYKNQSSQVNQDEAHQLVKDEDLELVGYVKFKFKTSNFLPSQFKAIVDTGTIYQLEVSVFQDIFKSELMAHALKKIPSAAYVYWIDDQAVVTDCILFDKDAFTQKNNIWIKLGLSQHDYLLKSSDECHTKFVKIEENECYILVAAALHSNGMKNLVEYVKQFPEQLSDFQDTKKWDDVLLNLAIHGLKTVETKIKLS